MGKKIKECFLYSVLGELMPNKRYKIIDIYETKEVISKRIVCDRCNGDGTHTNPNIDGNGLPDECVNDQDFMADYMRGVYDVSCEECKGNKIIDVIDLDYLDPRDTRAYWSYKDEERQAEIEVAYERRMGC